MAIVCVTVFEIFRQQTDTEIHTDRENRTHQQTDTETHADRAKQNRQTQKE